VKVSLISRASLFLAAFGIFGASIVSAQNFVGGVRGSIQDPGGAVIGDAKVTLLNDATGTARVTQSNAAGEYTFAQVEPATYSISVEAPGFKKLTRAGVIVGTQENVAIDLKMEIGQVSESVQVTGEVALIENTNASNGQVLSEQQIADLPNLGRNVFLLSKLANNIATGGDPRFNRFQDQSGSSQISVGGGPVRGNNYLIDGIPVTDATNRAVIIPLVEAVQEMKLQENTYDATMGRTGGGVFNTVLKTGTNNFHGDVFGYYRTTDFSGNTFFANSAGLPRAPTLWHNFGGGMGGPIYIPKVYNGKNKTFFYVSSEAYRQKTPVSNNFGLPSAAEKTGNFSASPFIIYDPLSTGARVPFTGNIIPGNRINPVGQAIINYLPNPQTSADFGTTNYVGTDSLFDRADEYGYKLEHSLTEKIRLTGSFMYYKSREPGGNPLGSVAGASSNAPYLLYRHVDATAINAILTPNPTTVVSLRFGFNRFPNFTEGISAAQHFNEASLGFPASFLSQLQANYFPQISFSNESYSLSNSGISYSNFYSKNLLGSVSKNVGRHNITYGMDYRVINSGPTQAYNAGIFTFNGVFTRSAATVGTSTGADYADLLLGYPSSGVANTALSLNVYVRYYGGYLQDDIRVNSKLTLNLGIRYEYETGEREINNGMVTNFDRSAINPIAAGLPAASGVVPYGVLQFGGLAGAPTACCSPSRTKFGPRFGSAYQLTAKTTLRAGIGMFYAPTVFGPGDAAPGYTQATTYVASNNGNVTPANLLSNPFPSGVIQPSGNSQGAATALGSTFSFLDPKKTGGGTVYQYSMDIQQELWKGIVFEIGYVGGRANGLTPAPTGTGTLPINQLTAAQAALGTAYLNASVPNPFFGLPGATGVIGAANVSRAQLLLPYPEYSTISENTTLAHSRYDSLIIKVQKRLSKNLGFLGTMTWQKNEDNEFLSGSASSLNSLGSAQTGTIQNIYNLGAEWALAAVDQPLRFTGSWTYRLPVGKGQRFLANSRAADWVLGGWSIQGTFIIANGFPMFINQTNLNSVIGGPGQRPNATGVSACESGSPESRINTYFNPAAFSLAPAYTFGNLSRNIPCQGPGQANTDASVFKTVTVKERFSAEFRAEALNLTNTPYFAAPTDQFGQGNFGHINYQANIPRILQLGLRFAW
jgi:hypothetical protein